MMSDVIHLLQVDVVCKIALEVRTVLKLKMNYPCRSRPGTEIPAVVTGK